MTTGHAEVRDVASILAGNQISGMPVCNANGDVIGVVSEGDILFKEHDPNLGHGEAAVFVVLRP